MRHGWVSSLETLEGSPDAVLLQCSMVLYTIFAAVWLISNKQSPAGAVARAVDASAVDATSCGPQ